ncbi:hypothetical protein LTR37_018524 [Vermiconidia calcicola]|uniref:Uncharacterized protein n=1 Tax=Vermiconidia calcicola TaxID=1690605 RepID=A0ACC3MII5_9PEZI|nr:hypothetical protein LTR37_018524 [Vermiconidia calcicola]
MIYYSNCTLPNESVSYVAAPNRQGRDPGWKGDVKWGWRRLRKSIKLTIVTILAPELILAASVTCWFNARKQLQKIHRSVPATVNTWTMVHMLFADIGGFVIRTLNSELEEQSSHSKLVINTSNYEAPNEEHRAEQSVALSDAIGQRCTQASLLANNSAPRTRDRCLSEAFSQQETSTQKKTAARSEDGGNSLGHFTSGSSQHEDAEEHVERYASGSTEERGAPHARGPSPSTFHLDAYTVRCAIEESILSPDLPTTEEIMDKSKNDLFTKLLTLIQILFFVITVLTRVIHGLDISQLELGVAGFVVCSGVTYLLTLSKPKSVTTAFILNHENSDRALNRIQTIIRRSPLGNKGAPFNNLEFPRDENLTGVYVVFGAAGTILGAIHLSGWTLPFPTPIDLLMWRWAALASTIMPLLAVQLSILYNLIGVRTRVELVGISGQQTAVTFGFIVLYSLSRLALMVEMIRCLFYLPPSAFVTTWTANIPHFG